MRVPGVLRAQFTRSSSTFARAASTSAIIVGASVLIGWLFNIAVLRSVYATFSPTPPGSALGLILVGAALRLAMAPASGRGIGRGIAIAGALVTVALSILTLAEYATHRDLGIDLSLRMSPTGAVNLLAVGIALLLMMLERGIPAAQILGLLASFVGVLAMTGYVYQVTALYAIGKYTPMSVEMAVMSAVLGLGVLCARPDRGLMIVLASPNVGGVVARRLLPLGVGFPFLLALLSYVGQVARLGKTQFGGFILLFFGIVMFTAPILWTAALLYRTDKKRERAERHLAAQYAVARILADSGPVREIAPPTLETICTNIGWSEGAIWEVESETNTLKAVAVFNRPAVMTAGSLAMRAWTLAQSIWTKTDAAFPIWMKGNVIGVIECSVPDMPARDDEVVKVMETIATQIGQFVGRRRSDREIHRLNRDLQDHAGQLEAANKELESFSYSVSHDLRAPLRHISGFVQLLSKRSQAKFDDQDTRYLSIIADACAKMGTLVDDLLAFSRMGRTEMMRARVDLNSIVQQIVHELNLGASGRSIDWAIQLLPEVEGDPSMIRIVLMNYISNAVKYTKQREDSHIEIGSASNGGAETTVYVRDNGAGFDMKYADKLFGVFQRLHRQDEFEGTGIGLATARRIISRHGGRTWAEAATDRGATFYFSLPNNHN